jgi:hypothetical protein
MTREEFSRAIEAFLGELGVLCLGESTASLGRFPEFLEHFREVSAALRDPATPDDEVLGAAYGLIDQYVGANWEQVLEESYRFYRDQRPASGVTDGNLPAA